MAAVDALILGQFHPKYGGKVTLGKDRRIATGESVFLSIAFSNDIIPIGQKFSVKILQKGSRFVSPISASSRSHPSDAPYAAGGAVHVVHCNLFFVRSGRW